MNWLHLINSVALKESFWLDATILDATIRCVWIKPLFQLRRRKTNYVAPKNDLIRCDVMRQYKLGLRWKFNKKMSDNDWCGNNISKTNSPMMLLLFHQRLVRHVHPLPSPQTKQHKNTTVSSTCTPSAFSTD